MHLISDLGDSAVLLPASLGLLAYLIRFGSRADAAAYAAALAICLATALVAKLALAACGGERPVFGVESPSGHAAFGAIFYGCLAVLFATGRPILSRLGLYGGALALVALIGVSRVALEAHTPQEVAVGLLIGGASVVLFRALRVEPERFELSAHTALQMSPVAALYALCLVLLSGRWSAEPIIDAIGRAIGVNLHLCQ
jgi:membrane-associated phospholipid phosphatase